MGNIRCWKGVALMGLLGLATGWVLLGCQNTPVDLSPGPAPLRMPPPGEEGECQSYEDSLTGGHVFDMYCASCHNARYLSERPFSNYKNVAAHMRVRADLTGKEYAKVMAFLQRWHDVPPPNAPVEPSPKRLIFSQPMPELREEQAPKPRPVPPVPAAVPEASLPAPSEGFATSSR